MFAGIGAKADLRTGCLVVDDLSDGNDQRSNSTGDDHRSAACGAFAAALSNRPLKRTALARRRLTA
jgi:hypothetical protein